VSVRQERIFERKTNSFISKRLRTPQSSIFLPTAFLSSACALFRENSRGSIGISSQKSHSLFRVSIPHFPATSLAPRLAPARRPVRRSLGGGASLGVPASTGEGGSLATISFAFNHFRTVSPDGSGATSFLSMPSALFPSSREGGLFVPSLRASRNSSRSLGWGEALS